MNCYDYAVIGAGIAGASFAARVAPQARVLLLEQEMAPGYHATGRSAALFSSLIGDHMIGAITEASREFFTTPPAGFTTRALLQPRCSLHIGRADMGPQAKQLACRPGTRIINTQQALAMVPTLRPESAVYAVLEQECCDIDVNELHQGYLRMARRHDAVLINDCRIEGLSRHHGLWTLDAGHSSFQARVVVNAAGAWADNIAELAGCTPRGLQPLRRTALLFDPPRSFDVARWPAVIAMDEAYYFKPDAGCLLASLADETPSPPCDAQAEDLDIAMAVDRIENATTLEVPRINQSWAGLRTFAPDRHPLIGFDRDVPDFFWLAGQGGYGVQTSPALSAFAAALALDTPLPESVLKHGINNRCAFSPNRHFASIDHPTEHLESPALMDTKL